MATQGPDSERRFRETEPSCSGLEKNLSADDVLANPESNEKENVHSRGKKPQETDQHRLGRRAVKAQKHICTATHEDVKFSLAENTIMYLGTNKIWV